MRWVVPVTLTLALALALGATPPLLHGPSASANGAMFANGLLPALPVPADNPQTDAKIRLGARLYFDTRLSADNTISCGTCHDPRRCRS